jgi:membrane protease YdiL (CAAX protease family)
MRVIEFLNRHSLVIGIVLMFALTWPFYSALGLFVGYGLAVAALIMTGLTLGRAGVRALLRRFLIWRVGVQWYLVILFGPAILGLVAIGLNFLVSGTTPDFTKVYARQLFGTSANLWLFVVPFFLVDALTNGEEMGWRGYVLPRLQARFSALVSSLILGAVWGLWHLPKFWATGDAESFALVLLHNLAMAVLFTWVYNSTNGSLLIVTLFHAAVNTAGLFLPLEPSLTGDGTLGVISIGIECVAAFAVVVVAGPARLSGLIARRVRRGRGSQVSG